ncbi:MAG: hypothetical protein GY808_19535 [Gammaproteobacteria bacterium]|nr:hypothetical protein [Gammaproteobacteria bacterium]
MNLVKTIFSKKVSIIFLCILQTTLYGIEPRWFEIEVIVFEQSNESRLDSEKWQQQLTLPDVSNSKDFLTPEPSSINLQEICLQGKMRPVLGMVPANEIIEDIIPFEQLPGSVPAVLQPIPESNTINGTMDEQQKEELEPEIPFIILDKELNQLNKLRSQLARSRGYRPLLHISWRQPVENKKNSQPIRLFSGKNYSDTFNPDGDARVDIASIDTFLTDDNKPIVPFSINSQTTYNKQNSPVDSDKSKVSPFSSNRSSLLPFRNSILLTTEDYRRSSREQLSHCQTLYQEQLANSHPDVWQLDGNIRIYVQRYLHLETDLILRIPGEEAMQLGAIETSLAADKLLDSLQTENLSSGNSQSAAISEDHFATNNLPAEPTNTTFGWNLADDFLSDDQSQSIVIQQVLNKYQMLQKRRLRSKEIHYIDHPLFGLLIQIRPYVKEAEDEDVPTTS